MKNTLLTFKERRLIYEDKLPERPGITDAIGQFGSAAGTLATSFAGLVDTVTRGLSRGVDLVDYGVAKAEKGIDILSEKIMDPGKPSNLPEYREMPTFFSDVPKSTGDRSLDAVLLFQLKLIFLKYKAVEYAEFLQDATNQSIILERAIDDIDYKNRIHRPRIQELSSLIEARENTINSGHLGKGDPRRIDLETELAAYKSEKEYLRRESSYEKDWPKPQEQQTEFPPGSGIYTDRLIFDSSQMVKIDLRELYRVTKDERAGHDRRLKEYGEEVDRLIYHRDRLLALADRSVATWPAETSFKVQYTVFQRQGQMRERSVTTGKFKTSGSPTDVGTLAGAIRRPASTATPTAPRPTPTHNMDDLSKFLR